MGAVNKQLATQKALTFPQSPPPPPHAFLHCEAFIQRSAVHSPVCLQPGSSLAAPFRPEHSFVSLRDFIAN